MAPQPLARLSPDAPDKLCREHHIALEDEGIARLAETASPAQFLSRLVNGGSYLQAIQYLAHALPKEDAVHWACLCAREAAKRGARPKPEEEDALRAAEDWAAQPDDSLARIALKAAQYTDMSGAGSLAAAAAFFSARSIATPPAAPVAPPEHMTGVMVAAAVLMATAQGPAQQVQERYRQCIQKAVQIASG